MNTKKLNFKQFIDPETSTYTYILSDPETSEAIIIDSVLEQTERDLGYINENNLKLKYILETHVHADHITGASTLKKETNAEIVLSAQSEVSFADVLIEHNQSLNFGNLAIKALHTPGHTNTCTSYYIPGMVFTGDALLIDGCGRTDFQSGSSENLFDSIHNHIFTLPDETTVYPGHDYKERLSSSVGQEKKSNSRLGADKSKEDFVKIMNLLNLDKPKKIEESVPANLKCGLDFEELRDTERNVPEISPKDSLKNKDRFHLVDVRREDEWTGELGHVEGSQLITLGDDFSAFLKTADKGARYVFICRSGNRSGTAVLEAESLGFKHTYNMRGGMLLWNAENLPKN